MNTLPEDGPEEDISDLWVVPLNEPTPPAPSNPDPPATDPPPPTLFDPTALPYEGFHPRLRRFDEAA